jgi:hypothetical protein
VIDDNGAGLRQLLARLKVRTLGLPKVGPAEIATEYLEALGFRAAGRHLLFAANARPAQ